MKDLKKTALLLLVLTITVLLVFAACDVGGGDDTDPVTYTVAYDGNGNTGGTVPVDSSTYEEGATVTVLGNTGNLTKTGYAFTGWNTAADGSGTSYTGGNAFVMGTENIVLNAVWAPAYSVTYMGNGNTDGTVPVDSSTYIEGETVTVLGNTGALLNIDGATTAYRFDGWNTEANGSGDDYAAAATFTMGSSDVTLYVKWTAYALRDTGPAGGLIFYIATDYTSGWRYLEAAPASTDSSAAWSDPHATLIGTDTSIGIGQANTAAIVTALSGVETGRAAQLCDALSVGIYDDWFLPSSLELGHMYTELSAYGVGGFSDGDYWSSSEYTADPVYAWNQYFPGGATSYGWAKTTTNYVRAARSF